MNPLFQKRQNQTEISIAVKVSETTQNVEIHLANQQSGRAFCSTDFRHIFGSTFRKSFVFFLGEKRPHKPVFDFAFVRIPSLLIYRDLIE